MAMNLENDWVDTAATTITSCHPGGRGGSREGDSGGGPFPERGGVEAWPTLVIESGVSPAPVGLRTAIRWWFAASLHAVKILLLIKANRDQGQLVVEKWTEDPSELDTPILCQTITVTLTPAALEAKPDSPLRLDCNSYIVEGQDLLLEFPLLFLRAPVPPVEQDIIIKTHVFQGLARLLFGTY